MNEMSFKKYRSSNKCSTNNNKSINEQFILCSFEWILIVYFVFVDASVLYFNFFALEQILGSGLLKMDFNACLTWAMYH